MGRGGGGNARLSEWPYKGEESRGFFSEIGEGDSGGVVEFVGGEGAKEVWGSGGG